MYNVEKIGKSPNKIALDQRAFRFASIGSTRTNRVKRSMTTKPDNGLSWTASVLVMIASLLFGV
ncbi:MAG: hypothetical protein KDJ55_00550, partial [Rhodobiaceae bacterium]|nr:hypothetical protein [Rhodobiaceae bacterium]